MLRIILVFALASSVWAETICSYDPTICNGTYSGDSLFLGKKGLTGGVPTQLGLLHATLAELRLDDNSLSGSLPSQLALLTNLVFLDLGGNDLSGSVPSQLGLLNPEYGCILLNKFSGTTSYDCPIPASPLLSPSPPPLEAAVSPPPPSTPPPPSPLTVHTLSSFVSIDPGGGELSIDESTTVLGDGSDARLLTIVSATLGGWWINKGQSVAANANRQIGDTKYSATTAHWQVCTLETGWLKTVQLVVTSKAGKLYARAVKKSHSRKSIDDCGTWPLDNIGDQVVDSSTGAGYGVASLSYTIGLSPAGTSRRALEVSSAARSTGNCLANLKCVATPPPPPSSPPSANKYCKKLKRQYKKKEEKWEKKCSA